MWCNTKHLKSFAKGSVWHLKYYIITSNKKVKRYSDNHHFYSNEYLAFRLFNFIHYCTLMTSDD